MADIVFVTPTESLALNQEVNGILILATKLLQANFNTKILRFCQIESYKKNYPVFIRDITNRLLEMDTKCISFYTLWPCYHIVLRIAREIKERNPDIIIVLGGPQASATAQETMKVAEFVDYICTGEGENTVVPFFEALLRNNCSDLASVPGLCYRKNGIVTLNSNEIPLCDLNELPHWDGRLLEDITKHPEPNIQSNRYFMPIDAGRGCPYSCIFCCTSNFWRRTYRLKSSARIIEDILYYNQNYGIKSFWFSHDAFTTNNKLVENVCDEIIAAKLDISWKCTARIDCITEDLIIKMKAAGLTQIELGIETGSPRMQKLINKHLNLERAKKMVSFLLEKDIHVGLFFMYGFPEETEEDLAATLSLLFSFLDMGVQHISMSFCSFNPTTDITNRYFDDLVLDPEIKMLTRGKYGYEHELEIIQQHKALFPFFYHLDTPVRNEYQYLAFLVQLYQMFPNSIRYVRNLYNGDDLKFYKDYYNNNRHYFASTFENAVAALRESSLDMVYNTIKDLNPPCIAQIKALLKFDHNIWLVLNSTEDIAIKEVYNFSYVDFKLKVPIEQYSDGKSEILLQKTNEKMDLQVLHIS